MPLRVLILCLHPDIPGGVVGFVELMKRRLGPDTQADSLLIGRRPDETTGLQTVRRLVRDSLMFLRTVLRTRYDVVHLNPSLRPKALLRDGTLLAILWLLRQRRIFIFFHGWDVALQRRVARNPVSRLIFCHFVGRAARIAVLSSTFRDALIGMGIDGGRIDVVSTMFDGEAMAGAARARRQEQRGAAILFLSRFAAGKGALELIEAFSRIADQFPDTHLTLAGDGDQRALLERRAAELGLTHRISFPGYVRDAEKTRLLLESDIFVLPSSSEGLPVALLEAMAAGAAVITSNVGGIPEVVRSPENGIILDEITPDSIGRALTEMLSDRDRAARIGAGNASLAWERFEANAVTRRIEALYGDVARGVS